MLTLKLSPSFAAACPQFRGVALQALVTNSPTSSKLKQHIMLECQRLQQTLTLDLLKLLPPIASTRAGYKACGKDPSRYRVSSEQLLRRVLQGKGLYMVNTLVDLLNVVSITSGYSIGGFDATNIIGEAIELDIGREGEPYEGIGRGMLNVSGMPIYRDAISGFATPTSDSERTKISLDTTRLLVFVNAYDSDTVRLENCVNTITVLLRTYAHCTTPISRTDY